MRSTGPRGVAVVAALIGVALGCSRAVPTPAAPSGPPPALATTPVSVRGLRPGAIATPGPQELLLDTNADPLFGPAPLIVRFSAAPFDKREARNPTYRWSFGDGSPDSTEQNPLHTYTKPGEYKVSVTVHEEGGKAGSEEFDLSVDEPTAD